MIYVPTNLPLKTSTIHVGKYISAKDPMRNTYISSAGTIEDDDFTFHKVGYVWDVLVSWRVQ